MFSSLFVAGLAEILVFDYLGTFHDGWPRFYLRFVRGPLMAAAFVLVSYWITLAYSKSVGIKIGSFPVVVHALSLPLGAYFFLSGVGVTIPRIGTLFETYLQGEPPGYSNWDYLYDPIIFVGYIALPISCTVFLHRLFSIPLWICALVALAWLPLLLVVLPLSDSAAAMFCQHFSLSCGLLSEEM